MAAIASAVLILISLLPASADVPVLSATVVARVATQPLADRIIVPRGFNVREVRADDGSESEVFAASGMVLSIARSPAADILAISVLRRMPGDSYAGADLYLIGSDGQQQIVLRQGPDQEVDAPNWTPDGRALIYQVGGTGVARPWIELATIDGAERKVLVRDAEDPSLSPNGATLAYLRPSAQETLPDRLVVRNLSDAVERDILPAGRFSALRSPRFSPDGRQIAFLTATMPVAVSETGPEVAVRHASWISDLFQARSAIAHGPPWDVWTIDARGGEPSRIASLGEDDPALAWAEDGQTLALFGVNGLWTIRIGETSPRRIGSGGIGRIDWGR